MTDRNEERIRLGRDSSPRERRPDGNSPNSPDSSAASERSSQDTYGTSGDTRSGIHTDSTRSAGSNDRSDQNKGTVDRLIDRAQEKGIFDKAEKMFRDKFGGGSGSKRR